MKAQEFIRDLGQRLNLPSLKLNEANVCRVIFGDYPIDFETLSGQDVMYLIAELGPLPATEQSESCFKRLLMANRYGLETKNATLSIDPDRDAVILHRFLDISGMDYNNFELRLDEFFERFKYWKAVYTDVESETALGGDDLAFMKV